MHTKWNGTARILAQSFEVNLVLACKKVASHRSRLVLCFTTETPNWPGAIYERRLYLKAVFEGELSHLLCKPHSGGWQLTQTSIEESRLASVTC